MTQNLTLRNYRGFIFFIQAKYTSLIAMFLVYTYIYWNQTKQIAMEIWINCYRLNATSHQTYVKQSKKSFTGLCNKAICGLILNVDFIIFVYFIICVWLYKFISIFRKLNRNQITILSTRHNRFLLRFL